MVNEVKSCHIPEISDWGQILRYALNNGKGTRDSVLGV